MQIKSIALEKIKSAGNVRNEHDEELGGLMESIERHGLLQPILVVQRKGHYELIAGHRRYAAMKARNEPFIDCFVRDDIYDRDIPFLKLAENVQRKQLSPGELVECFDTMLEENRALSKRKLAALLGKSDAWIYLKYKAARILDELLDAGLDEEAVNELSEADLLNLSHVSNKSERKKVARKYVTSGGRKEEIEKAASYEKKKTGTRRDMTGGFYVFPSGSHKAGIVCKDTAIRDEVIKELLKLKVRLAEKGNGK